MSAVGKQVAVDANATHLLASGVYVTVKNQDAVNSVFLGGSGVTAANGFELKFGQQIEYDASIDDLYAICAATKTARVDVVGSRRSYS